ncbi:unnamed protein product [Leptosia nina]|uniref:Uncharacterized protein n=1 Tax=Leptosia nina TaxID=320188 RepID=A0AAV1IU25_9NEOP
MAYGAHTTLFTFGLAQVSFAPAIDHLSALLKARGRAKAGFYCARTRYFHLFVANSLTNIFCVSHAAYNWQSASIVQTG